tara:strand:- start:25945 stop:26211 length:267 start_codon:yes stop_codon:yes gene_type:complete
MARALAPKPVSLSIIRIASAAVCVFSVLAARVKAAKATRQIFARQLLTVSFGKGRGAYRRRVTRPEEEDDLDEELPDEVPLLMDLPEG